MAIYWGSYSAHARAGISYTISPSSPSHNDTEVNVTWNYYAGTDGYGFDDNWTYSYSADGWTGGSESVQGSGFSSKLIQSHTVTYGINYGSTKTVSASGSIRGMYNGGTPDVTVNAVLPARPYAKPSAGENPTASGVGNTDVTISWSAPTDNGGDGVDQYQLQIDTGTGFTSPIWNHTFNQTGAASDHATGLTPNTHYYARVRAHNSVGWGDWTPATYCQFTTLGGVASSPSAFVSSSWTQTSVSLSWRASNGNGGGAITYRVQQSTTSAFTSPVEQTTTKLGATFSGLVAATTYYFRVRAENSFGNSGWSATVTQATRSTPTYNDSGDVVTLVNNLSSAVADKLVHLGASLSRGKVGALSFPSGLTILNMGTNVETRGKDAPTYLGTGSDDFKINYTGTYMLEFGLGFALSGITGSYLLGISVNGLLYPTSTLERAGLYKRFASDGTSTPAWSYVTCTRHLEKGDTVGWRVNNSTNGTLNSSSGSDLTAFARVTMIGF